MVNVGLAGCGYWGSRYVRVFNEAQDARLTALCDRDESLLEKALGGRQGILATSRYEELLASDLDAVIIATPAVTHFPLARQALLAGKHVLVEKPFAVNTAESLELVQIAEERGLALMVGATFLYSQPVRMLKELIQRGELGEVFYVHSSRLNFGLLRPDVDVLWDLAPHDLSIFLYLLGDEPVGVGTRGVSYINPRLPEVAHADLMFPDGVFAHLHVSWLEPQKIRRLTVVGSERMVVYDDTAANESIRIYDRQVRPSARNGSQPQQDVAYHFGDVRLPYVKDSEPLKEELSHFIRCVQTGARPLSDGRHGLSVVRILEALSSSLQNGGEVQYLAPIPELEIAQARDLAAAPGPWR